MKIVSPHHRSSARASGSAGRCLPPPRTATRRMVVRAMAVALSVALHGPGASAWALPDDATLRRWVEDMKDAPRGPFKQISWFCKDGTVLPAKEGCAGHGGGIQHGQWSDRVVQMREGGFKIVNVLGDMDGEPFVGSRPDLLWFQQLLVERFLMAADDGWVFRVARTYRGALQAEDEEAGARRIIDAMLTDPDWRADERFFPLREAIRLLPLERESQVAAATGVRQLAKVIADKDPRFEPLRIKIHGMPDAGDAERVRDYARSEGRAALVEDYARLADDIDTLYRPGTAGTAVEELAAVAPTSSLAAELRKHGKALASAKDATNQLYSASYLLGLLRYHAPKFIGVDASLQLLETSLALETEAYGAGNTLLASLPRTSRQQRLDYLGYCSNALYGTGLITKRHRDGLLLSLKRVKAGGRPSLGLYRQELRYVGRAPEWAGRTLVFHFSEGVERLARIEPEAHLFPQDRLRGSPLLFCGATIDSLIKDANQLAGIEHMMFGERVGVGLRALNPGLARGIVRTPYGVSHTEDFDADGIYLLPETISELPPVAGILTQGEGSSLSHVQLLARNLGIPNVVVGDSLLSRVRARDGDPAVLAVSPGGTVHLVDDGPRWDEIFGRSGPGDFRIRPDLTKLDLDATDVIALGDLRAADSGRLAGPKSANLGELRHLFGDAVPDGVVIPFGVFRQLLDEPFRAGGPSTFDWMKENYRRIDGLSGAERERAVRSFLSELRTWISNVDVGSRFEADLEGALRQTFGPDGTYGVFVRSDTNVEDLPGFTGAGLNLTVANVVGFDNILKAIHEVWASPFTERSYSWRQAHMDDPEFVFPAVLVQHAFPSEKSGVMVTADVEGQRPDWVSVAVNEGVGGAVDGQAAESLLISKKTGEVLFQAQATAPRRRVLSPDGGLDLVPATGTDGVLSAGEIAQLVQLARDVPTRFPSLRSETGEPVPADIEFGFRHGRLTLLQIRPFVENKNAQRSQYLNQLDEASRARGATAVDLGGVPGA
jgi:hypothetical protein